MSDFDRHFSEVERRIERSHKRMKWIAAVVGALYLLVGAGVIRLIVWVIQNPEAIGAWFRRLLGGAP